MVSSACFPICSSSSAWLIAMLTIDIRLALLTYLTIPVMLGVLLVWRRYAIPTYRAVRLASSRLTGYAAENISGMKVSQSFRRESANYRRFEELGTATLRALPALRLAELGRCSHQWN